MQTVSTLFEVELKKLIDEDVERLKDNLAVGTAVPDHATYREYVGEIRAMRKVIDMFDFVQSKMSER